MEVNRLFLPFAVLTGLALLAAEGRAQDGIPAGYRWTNLTPIEGPAPEPRRNGAAIYDPVLRRVILFGGIGTSGHFNDVWAFDLVTLSWTELETQGVAPAPRLGLNAVYDPNGHQMVIWAGQQDTEFYDDTWTLDLTSLTWTDVSPSRRPAARYGSASVFDPIERRLVQFAGFTELSRRFQDTQAFDLDTHTWEELTPPGDKPEIRCLLTSALHEPTRRMIIYGGQRNGPLDDIWAFDLAARTWTSLTPSERPPGRLFATSFVDRRDRFIVFGGSTEAGDVNETWAFDLATGTWSRLEIEGAPSPRNGMMGAYIVEEDRLIVFGGIAGDTLLNEVWELRREAPSPPDSF